MYQKVNASSISHYYSNNQDPGNYYAVRIIYISVASMITVLTIFGNLFVIIAVRTNQKLKRVRASILMASLALADLLVGSFVMPLAVVQLWTNGEWTFGPVLCQFWTALDVIGSTASIFTVCAISIDRYVGVARPLEYAYIMTRRKLWTAVSGLWILSVVVLLATVNWNRSSAKNWVNSTASTVDIATSALQGTEDTNKTPSPPPPPPPHPPHSSPPPPPSSSPPPPSQCHVGEQLDHVIYSEILSFFIPLLIILAVYYRVYRLTQTRKQNFVQTDKGVMKWRKTSRLTFRRTSYRTKAGGSFSSPAVSAKTSLISKHSDLATTEPTKKKNKAAVTLGLVVGAFVLCWLPFFTLFMIYTICNCVPMEVLDLFTWFGYSNSALNPLIYALSMKTFKETFRNILSKPCLRKKKQYMHRRKAICQPMLMKTAY